MRRDVYCPRRGCAVVCLPKKVLMRRIASVFAGVLIATASATLLGADAPPPWRIYIANDTCPDVTWGLTEEATRQAFADLINAHLDEMIRTDAAPPENRDHYNATAFIELEAFLDKYPARQEELIRRIREGRVCVSPFLCNSLWGFQSVEGALRTFYPARRFEREHGIPLTVAEHIELPSLPWGMATLLADSGIRWTSVPFYDYDSTFKALRNPPLFRWQGPDGSEVRTILDAWASLKSSYMQGAAVLKDPRRTAPEWVNHYARLGPAFPLRVAFASGTHSDISPKSGEQARGFAEAIAAYNREGTNPVRLVNGTLAQFCREADAAETRAPFLPVVRGCFGHSWELWPVSLARSVAQLRLQEREYLAAEALVALAGLGDPAVVENTRKSREQAEWNWAMLSDHAWNGTDLSNKRHNASLRQRWGGELARLASELQTNAWPALGLKADQAFLTVFNPLSFTNDLLVVTDAPATALGVTLYGRPVPAQVLQPDGTRQVAFVARQVPPFGFREFEWQRATPKAQAVLRHTATNEFDSPFFRLVVDPRSGALASLVHKATGQQLVARPASHALGETVHFDGREHRLEHATWSVDANGPVLGRVAIHGRIGELRVTNYLTLYATLDRVDFDYHIHQPARTNEQRLCHYFPLGGSRRDWHVETTGAVIRPALQPEGDLLPGADLRRFAVQDFVDVAPAGRVGVTLAPFEAFMLRLDGDTLAFEALGNDQNWKECTQDQDGVTEFRFRYSLRAHAPGYNQAAAMAWSAAVRAPLVVAAGRLPRNRLEVAYLSVDPHRAIATCLKPSDQPGSADLVIRLWETSGRSGPLTILTPPFRQAANVDLLERTLSPAAGRSGQPTVTLRGLGFGSVRLER